MWLGSSGNGSSLFHVAPAGQLIWGWRFTFRWLIHVPGKVPAVGLEPSRSMGQEPSLLLHSSLRGLLGIPHSMVAGFQEHVSQENKVGVHGIFVS